MDWNYWMDSTGEEPNSSGGVLQIGSMKPWNRKHSERDETKPAWGGLSQLKQEIESRREVHIETVGAEDFLVQHEALIRLVCHWFVDATPREGLIEIAEQLQQTYQFCTARSAYNPPPQLPPATHKARVTTVLNLPTFSFEDDE